MLKTLIVSLEKKHLALESSNPLYKINGRRN